MDNLVPSTPQTTPTHLPAPSTGYRSVYTVVLVLAGVMILVGAYLAFARGSWALLSAGIVILSAGLLAWPLAAQASTSCESSSRLLDEKLTPVLERFEQFSVMMDLLSEQQLISDRAKAVAFREKDRDAIRRAIQEEIFRQDWEAAIALCYDMETLFGYKQEADRFREEIAAKRQQFVRKQVDEIVGHIDKHVRSEQWNLALREAEHAISLYPDDEQVRRFPADIESRRQALKKQFLDSWHDAVNRKDVDGSIEILKKLDVYLSSSEAESLQETARGVFKEKLNILRAQFAMSVQEHNWTEATRVGDIIIRDFPNTQMAKEVREKMDTLRQRATGGEPVAAAT